MNAADEPSFRRVFPGEEAIAGFQRALKGWFRRHGGERPWRGTSDPYAILVSELMLQQTRVATVLEGGYYARWMARFPDWASLAEAPEEEVLRAWEGLGYYNRARNLRRAAQLVMERHGGVFPENQEGMLALPGVGRYTAGAVASFAFGQRAAVVDGNVVRVLARILDYRDPVDLPGALERFWGWAAALTPARGAALYNAAIMELGQRVCRRSSPGCEACPVREWCESRRRGSAAGLPRKAARKTVERRSEQVLLAVRRGRVLLSPEAGTRRRGLWRLPEITAGDAAGLECFCSFPYTITRYRVDLRVHLAAPGAGIPGSCGDARWFPLAEPGALPPLGAPYSKALAIYREGPGATGDDRPRD